jgi:hypothetical protein
MSLFVVAILMILPFVALAGMIAVGAFLAVQIGYEIVDRRATSAAVKLHADSRTPETETVRPVAPAPTAQAETARVA